MRRPKWDPLVKKAVAACVAAIETYNKPVCPHREETFAILVVCAWEALLKARVAKERGMEAIYAREPVAKKDGTHGKRTRVRTNRSGNPMTIGIEAAMKVCEELADKKLAPACRTNIESLMEVRDNAVHFHNEDRDLARMVHEAGAAALANFCRALDEWFGIPPSTHRFSILPLSFEPLSGATALTPAEKPKQVANLMKFLDDAADAHPFEEGKYAAVLRVETRIVGNRKDGIAIKATTDPTAPRVHLTETEVRDRWPMTYNEFVARVRKRITGFKLSPAFHAAKERVKADQRLAHERRLDPKNKKSPVTFFYADAAVDAVVRELAEASAPATA